MSRFIPLLAALALSGCVVQPPNYVRYDAPAAGGAYVDSYADRDARAEQNPARTKLVTQWAGVDPPDATRRRVCSG